VIVRRLDVLRGEEAAVVELHVRPDLHGQRTHVLGELPGLREIAHHLGTGVVGGIRAEQGVVVGSDGMDEAERLLAMTVEGRGF